MTADIVHWSCEPLRGGKEEEAMRFGHVRSAIADIETCLAMAKEHADRDEESAMRQQLTNAMEIMKDHPLQLFIGDARFGRPPDGDD